MHARPQSRPTPTSTLAALLLALAVVLVDCGGGASSVEGDEATDAARTDVQADTTSDAVLPDAGPGEDPGPSDPGAAPDPGTDDADATAPDQVGETPVAADVADAVAPLHSIDDCLNRTHDEKECKDCCDCSGLGCQDVVACRDACPLHDFGGNADFVAVSAPAVLGPSGDYAACTSLPTAQDCKACCDCDGAFACGDWKFCRNACAGTAGWPPLEMSKIGTPVAVPGTFQFAEGPLWDAANARLLFSDIAADTIYQLKLPSTVTVFRTPSHGANGLGFDLSGRLLAAEHQSRSVTRTEADGTVVPLATAWDGQPFNSPNDLVVRADGTIYFTDPTYGLGSAPSDLGFTGLYRVDPADGLHLEAQIDGQPNGVALAPDEKKLYVAATTANRLLSFAVAVDGTLSQQAEFAEVQAPDGLAVDQAGNLYVAGQVDGQGALVVVTSAGKVLGSIEIPEGPTNCGFGEAGGKTLFVTARTALYRIPVPIPGD